MSNKRIKKASPTSTSEVQKKNHQSVSKSTNEPEVSTAGQHVGGSFGESQAASQKEDPTPFNAPHGSQDLSNITELADQISEMSAQDGRSSWQADGWKELADEVRYQKTLLTGDISDVSGKIGEVVSGLAKKFSALVSKEFSSKGQILTPSLKKAGESILAMEKSIIEKTQGLFPSANVSEKETEKDADL